MNDRGTWKGILVFCLIFSGILPLLAHAQGQVSADLHMQTVAVADAVMDDIAARITANKYRYLVFSNFDAASMFRNPDGFKQLKYSYQLTEERTLELEVMIVSANTKPGMALKDWRQTAFPLIGIKVYWKTANAGFYLEGFDLNALVEDAVWPLAEFQQKQLPLKLSIETPKNDYEIGEPVDIDLVVKNVSDNQLRVKPLDRQSLYCTMNEQDWGVKDPKPAPSKSTLGAGEEMRYLLKLKGIMSPGDFRITCSYGIGYQGIRPQARKVLKVNKASIKDN